MSNESDEEIGRKILNRFSHIFNGPTLAVEVNSNDPAMGAPPRDWIPNAIDQIEDLIDAGMSKNKACRKVADEIAKDQNIKPETVEMTFRRYQREHWYEEFCRCVITKDLKGSVAAYKRLTLTSKRKLGLK